MACWRIIGLKLFVLALILLLSINSNSGEKFNDNVRKLHLTKDQADSAPRYSSLIDSNGSLRLANGWQFERNRRDVPADMESDPINPATAVKSYKGEEKKRDKRLAYLAPAIPAVPMALFLAIATAIGSAISSGGKQISTDITFPLDISRKNNEREGQTPRDKNYHPPPKTEDITGFPGLVTQKPKTPVQGGGGLRKRWKDPQSKKTYEWDSRHGELEGYDKSGKHTGSYRPDTGEKIKDAVPGRKIEN